MRKIHECLVVHSKITELTTLKNGLVAFSTLANGIKIFHATRGGYLEIFDRINLDERLLHKHNFKNFPSFHSAYTHYGLSNGFHQYAQEQIERQAALFGIEYRFPFWDQRLMEFCLLIPDNQRLQGHTNKRILRNAAISYLPSTIRDRCSKGDYSGSLSTFIVNHKYLLEEGLEIAKTGWVDENRVNEVYADWGEDFSKTCYNHTLYAVFATELCYRSVISREDNKAL